MTPATPIRTPGLRGPCLLLLALVFLPAAARAQAGGMRYQLQNYMPPPLSTAGPPPSANPEASPNRPPKVLYAVKPRYPLAYAEKGVEGSVLVDFIVLSDGTVTGARAVKSPDPRLSQAAESAVMQWRFQPRYRDGQPVDSHLRVPIVFTRPKSDPRADPEAAAIEARARGEEALGRNSYPAALAAFDEAVQLTPDSPDLLYDRGLAWEGSGDAPRALADFSAAARLNPDDVRFQLALGRLDARLKDAAGALSAYVAAVRLAPDLAAAYAGRGRAYAAEGRDDEALEDFNEALALDPKDGDAQAGQRAVNDRRASLDPGMRAWIEVRYRTFQMVWRTVNESYFDPTFGGVDWAAMRDKYRAQLGGVRDNAGLRYLLSVMLAELKKTHFAILPKEGAVFNPSQRVRIGTAGTEVAIVGGSAVIAEVKPGSAGAAAGLRPGDLVTRVDAVVIAKAMEPLVKAGIPASKRALYLSEFVQSRLEGPVGSKVSLGLLGADGAARQAVVTCRTNDAVWSEPAGHFPSVPIHCEASRGPDGIAVLRFNAFALPVVKPARALLLSLHPEDGLIIDLRGNGGGVTLIAPGIAGWLCATPTSLGTMHSREGSASLDVYPQDGAFPGPVAILVDGRSASTSEILASGLQETGRARVFGERSAGAALPSLFKDLPTGDLFQYAVADAVTPKSAVLEGTGVTPDEGVVRTRADLAAGRDPVLAAARAWLARKRASK
jgi:carboxyl-terminal processing protease